MKRTSNIRARNMATGETCGHHHHSREKALECIVSMGWDPLDCVVEEFNDKNDRKGSLHHKPKHGRKGTREAEF